MVKRDFGFPGQITSNDEDILYELALKSKDTIVEVGSWTGLSTCVLANGSDDGYKVKVYAIDHFKGSKVHLENPCFDTSFLYERFCDNISKAGYWGIVRPIPLDIDVVPIELIKIPIGLLFIDGDHTYENIKRDFDKLSPYVEPKEGIVAFHDYLTNEECVDVTAFVNGVIAEEVWEVAQPKFGSIIGLRRKRDE